VARRHSLSPNDLPDLLQEIRIALWEAGIDRAINVSWVFHTANHKVVDLERQNHSSNAEPDGNRTVSCQGQDPELLHLLRACAGGLPAPLDKFYELRYEQGLSQRATAARMGLDRSSIQRMDRHCRRFMKDGVNR